MFLVNDFTSKSDMDWQNANSIKNIDFNNPNISTRKSAYSKRYAQI